MILAVGILVLLPYKFTLLSNEQCPVLSGVIVLLPYKFTLLSNADILTRKVSRFYYPINLHYSQTTSLKRVLRRTFYYPINLHYSQTCGRSL